MPRLLLAPLFVATALLPFSALGADQAEPHEAFAGVTEFSLLINVTADDPAAKAARLDKESLFQHVGRWMTDAGFRVVAQPNGKTGATLSVSVMVEKSPETNLYAVAVRSTVWQLVTLPNKKLLPAITWENQTALVLCDADGLKQIPSLLDQYLARVVKDYQRANPGRRVKVPEK